MFSKEQLGRIYWLLAQWRTESPETAMEKAQLMKICQDAVKEEQDEPAE